MKIKHLSPLFLLFIAVAVSAQVKKKTITLAPVKNTAPASTDLPRPKLVVGIVVDQMRWDYLYRYSLWQCRL